MAEAAVDSEECAGVAEAWCIGDSGFVEPSSAALADGVARVAVHQAESGRCAVHLCFARVAGVAALT